MGAPAPTPFSHLPYVATDLAKTFNFFIKFCPKKPRILEFPDFTVRKSSFLSCIVLPPPQNLISHPVPCSSTPKNCSSLLGYSGIIGITVVCTSHMHASGLHRCRSEWTGTFIHGGPEKPNFGFWKCPGFWLGSPQGCTGIPVARWVVGRGGVDPPPPLPGLSVLL